MNEKVTQSEATQNAEEPLAAPACSPICKEYRRIYAIRRHDGKIFPERFTSPREAHGALMERVGGVSNHGLAHVVEILEENDQIHPPRETP